MPTDIRQLTKAGEQFYPQTHLAALVGYGENGRAIDDEPTAGSDNLVKSGYIFDESYNQDILEYDNGLVRGSVLIGFVNGDDGVLKRWGDGVLMIAYNVEGLSQVFLYSASQVTTKYYAFYNALDNNSVSADGKHNYKNGVNILSVPASYKYLVVQATFNNVGNIQDISLRKELKGNTENAISIIDNSLGLVPCKEVRDGYIKNTDGDFTYDAVSKTAVFDISGINSFIIKSKNLGDGFAAYYSFYDSLTDEHCVDGKHDFVKNGETVVTKPVDANYLFIIVHFADQGDISDFSVIADGSMLQEFHNNELLISKLENKTNYGLSEIPSVQHNKKMLKPAGYIDADTIDSMTTDWIDCIEGDEFLYCGFGSGSSEVPEELSLSSSLGVSWLFGDDDGVVSAWTVNTHNKIISVIIPQGVTRVLFNSIVKFDTNTYIFGVIKQKSVLSVLTKKWADKLWCCVGDSLTEHNIRASKNYHDYVHDATGISIYNLGVSGSGYKERYTDGRAFYQRMGEIPNVSDVITIFGSGNDMHQENGVWKYEIGSPTDTGTSTLCGCINATLDYIQEHFPLIPLGVVTPTPWASYGGLIPSRPGNRMELYSEAIIEICKRRGVPCLDLYHESLLHPESMEFRDIAYMRDGTYTASNEGVTGAIQVDEHNINAIHDCGLPNAQIGDWVLPSLSGVHPDEYGHKLIAPRFESFLNSLLLK